MPILEGALDCDAPAAEASARALWLRLAAHEGCRASSILASAPPAATTVSRKEEEEAEGRRRREAAGQLSAAGVTAPAPRRAAASAVAAPEPELSATASARAARRVAKEQRRQRKTDKAAAVASADVAGGGWSPRMDDERVEPMRVGSEVFGQSVEEFETLVAPVRSWDAEALAGFIRGLTELGGSTLKPKTKDMLECVAKHVAQAGLTADLLLISGSEVLLE